MCAPLHPPQSEWALVNPGWTEKGWFHSLGTWGLHGVQEAGTNPVLRHQTDEQYGQDPEREEQDGEKPPPAREL